MVNKYSKSSHLSKLIIAGVVLVVLGSCTALWIRHNNSSEPSAPGGVKLAPATKEEKKQADDNKDRIAAEQKNGQSESISVSNNQAGQTSSSKKPVSVVITSASASSVNAYVNGVFEDGGTCTASFTQGRTVITRTSAGFANVSYTQCVPITPDLPNASGWSVVVSYSSSTASGISPAQTF